jgi:hypothetical protein
LQIKQPSTQYCPRILPHHDHPARATLAPAPCTSRIDALHRAGVRALYPRPQLLMTSLSALSSFTLAEGNPTSKVSPPLPAADSPYASADGQPKGRTGNLYSPILPSVFLLIFQPFCHLANRPRAFCCLLLTRRCQKILPTRLPAFHTCHSTCCRI